MNSNRRPPTIAHLSHSGDVNACDPALVFSLKALILPCTSALTLFLCLAIWQRPIVGAYFLVCVMGFVGTGEFIELTRLDYRGTLRSALQGLTYILWRWIALWLCIAAVLYLSRVNIGLSDPPLLTWLFITPFAMWGVYLGTWMLLLQLGVKHLRARTAVIVGLTPQARRLQQMFTTYPLLGIRPLGAFDNPQAGAAEREDAEAKDDASLPSAADCPYLGSLEDLADYVREHNVNLVYITLPMSGHPQLSPMLDALHDTVASIYLVPDVSAIDLISARIEVVHGMPLIAICESPFFGMRGVVKRASDIVLSSLILLLISPLMIGVALGVKLSSPGPAVFRQRRYGLDGREITVYKFRSMSVTEDGDKSYTQVTRNDARVTPFGAFIRKTSLDELPQFLNVLEGTMSIVGPRPHAVAVNERYRQQIQSYMMRHKVKPGITGWAQVNGYRGGDDLESMTRRVEYDLDYLANWSLLFDLKIIARTFTVVFKDVHAF